MKINTKYHGAVEIDEKEILHFEKGIPGFFEEKKFIMIPLSDDDTFFVMQSIKKMELAFVVSSPFSFFREYDFKLENSVVEELELDSEKDISVFSILTVQDPFGKTTANLQAPVVINLKNRKAKQVILYNEMFSTKHSIFEKTEVKG
jgi:flagellar assembly factor FliW